MAHQNHVVDKLSTRLSGLLPEYIREDAPIFEAFLQSYFEYLESEILVLESVDELDAIKLEDGTVEGDTSILLLEDGTDPLESDVDNAKLIYEQDKEPLSVGEYIYGETNKSVAKILTHHISNVKKILIIDTVSGTGFVEGEKIIGRDGNQTGIVSSYKENSIVASNRLLDYANIDETLESFLQYFQKDFIPSLDLKDTQNKRLTLKNIGKLYKQKGTAESVQFLMRILYGLNSEIKYPIDETIFASESDFSEDRRMFVVMDAGGIPQATDKIIQYNEDNVTQIDAEAVVEQVTIINVSNRQYSISISDTHRGTFLPNKRVTFEDRDGVTSYQGTVKGIISGVLATDTSTYFGLEDDTGDLLLETGSGLLFEKPTIGSMYDLNDQIRFTGSKTDTEEVDAFGIVAGLSRGPVEEIYLEDSGSGYSANDIIIFEDEGTEGGGAEAIISAVGDEITLENASALDQYELIATAGQTTFGGVDSNGNSIRDLNNKPIALNGLKVKVFVDGIEQSKNNFEEKLDRVVFTTSPTPSGGERVEIVSEFSRLVEEDGDPIILESSDQRIRRVLITNGGTGYQKLPKVFPGGYLYFDDVSGYTVGEVVTGQSSSATGIISRIDTKNKRLVIKRQPTDTGEFIEELILGGSSTTERTCTLAKVTAGTGAKLYAWSSRIGGVEKVRFTNQGYNFDENAIVGDNSFFNIMITDPTTVGSLSKNVVFTGQTSGATGSVVSFDAQRNILKFTTRNGTFQKDEEVTYANNDSFKVIEFDPYDARGEFAGEGVILDNFLGEKGYASNSTSNIQDSKLYQTHSYVIKVGKAIDEYRSVVKDLVHPAGHIFFGEVAVENVIVSDDKDGRFVVDEDNTLALQQRAFVPTIIINLEVHDHFTLEEGTIRELNSYNDKSNRLLHEDGQYIDSEDSFEPHITRNSQVLVLFDTKKTEVDNFQMAHILRDYLNEGTEVERHRVEIIKKFISSATETTIDNEVTGSVAPVAEARETFIQKSPRLDGVVSVLNLVTQDNNYLKVQTREGSEEPERRPSDQGKVIQISDHLEEHLILEDGAYFQSEEPYNVLTHEPSGRDFAGEDMSLEDGSGKILLEDATVPEDVHRFLTERSRELYNPYFYLENNQDRLVLETGEAIVSEGLGTGSLVSFVPFGHTFRTINKIAFQDTYKISYYLLDESDGSEEQDRIVLESGTEGGSGHVLMETCEREGMRIHQLNDLLQNFYISGFSTHENRRTNIAFSSYVSSSNITNSTLESL
jgi:hypothetical protein